MVGPRAGVKRRKVLRRAGSGACDRANQKRGCDILDTGLDTAYLLIMGM